MTTIPVYVQALVEAVELPQITPTPSQFGFFQPLSVPPKQTKANVGPPWVLGTPPLITITPSKFDFFQPLSIPPRQTKANVGPNSFFGQPPLITVTPSKWDFYQQLSAPPPRTRANSGSAWFGIAEPPQITVTPSKFDFYQQLSRPPTGVKSNVGPAIVFGYPPPPPAWDWYRPLSSVPPLGIKANVGQAWFGISQPQAGTVTPSNWDFYQALSAPPAITKAPPAFNLLSPYIPAPPPAPAPVTGGHWLPPTAAELARQKRLAEEAERAREELWATRLRDQQELHQQIMDALHPERVIGVSLPDAPASAISRDDDEDEDDTDFLLLNI